MWVMWHHVTSCDIRWPCNTVNNTGAEEGTVPRPWKGLQRTLIVHTFLITTDLHTSPDLSATSAESSLLVKAMATGRLGTTLQRSSDNETQYTSISSFMKQKMVENTSKVKLGTKDNMQFVEYHWSTEEGITFPISTLISLNPRSTFSCHLCMHQAGLHWGSLPYTTVFGNLEWGQCVVVPMLHYFGHDFPPPDSHYTHERRDISIKLGISALQRLNF